MRPSSEPTARTCLGEHVNPHPGGNCHIPFQGRLDGTDHGLPIAVCGVRLGDIPSITDCLDQFRQRIPSAEGIRQPPDLADRRCRGKVFRCGLRFRLRCLRPCLPTAWPALSPAYVQPFATTRTSLEGTGAAIAFRFLGLPSGVLMCLLEYAR